MRSVADDGAVLASPVILGEVRSPLRYKRKRTAILETTRATIGTLELILE